MFWRNNILAVLLLCCTWCLATSEEFHEALTFRPLQDGRLATRFTFTTLLRGAYPRDPSTLQEEDESQHYAIFPLALGQVLREYAVTELHLTLNAGKWDYDHWGYPDEPGVGTGAELWAWMGESAARSVDERWKGLRNALSGQFCASLGSLDEQRTTSPELTFRPEGSLPQWGTTHQLRHGTLPSEHVCTENLTPFLKLLPCKSLTGIASLLNPHRLFDADWHGLGVHVRYLENEGIEVRLSFQSVFDPVRYSNGRRDWSLRSVFDRVIDRSCPIAHSSEIRVAIPKEETAVAITPDSYTTHAGFVYFNVSNASKPLDISMSWPDEQKFEYGSSQSRGRLSVSITNHMPITIQTSYLESMPWLLQFYLHSLQIYSNGVSRDDLISIVSYIPSVPHVRPTLFQAILTLPPKSTLHLSMDVIKPFLRYTEHPPDAQRGWDLPPAVLVPLLHSNSSTLDPGLSNPPSGFEQLRLPRRMYTPVLLVDLATPDFSMPYNVIIMSCTLIALIFGMVFNLLTRKFTLIRVSPEPK
ncbi:unnamed protein product [Somion occarium]|uniref:GPI transamidase component PIG-T n=1 Tax=Somion occarium TaxID=3059160 RepID=A0ABP1E150_9APHY